MTWSHFRFKQYLKAKCEVTNTKLLIVDESYTSKTCGQCKKINMKLGSSKKFICSNCGLNIDRDLNAARNIYIKNKSFL